MSGLALVMLVAFAAQRPGLEEDAPPPSLELLEFIASFQTADGEWIDPLSLPAGEQDEDADEADKDKVDDQGAAVSDPEF